MTKFWPFPFFLSMDNLGTRKRNGAFTLIEILIGMVVLLLLVHAVSTLLSSAFRGTRQGQESTDHIRIAAVLFRYLDSDLRNALSAGIIQSDGQHRGGPVNAQTGNQIAFWTHSEGTLKLVRYFLHTVSATQDEIRREIGNGTTIERVEHLGTGMVRDFHVTIRSSFGTPHMQVKFNLLGKLKTSEFTRIFTCGVEKPKEVPHWVFDY